MIDRRPIMSALASSLSASTGRPVTVLEAPTAAPDANLDAVMPYALLEPGTMPMPTMFSNAWDEAEMSFQATSVGQTYAQAEWMADKVRAGYLSQAVTIPGYGVMAQDPDDGPRPPEKAGDRLWSVSETFRLRISRG